MFANQRFEGIYLSLTKVTQMQMHILRGGVLFGTDGNGIMIGFQGSVGGGLSTALHCFCHNITHVWYRFSQRQIMERLVVKEGSDVTVIAAKSSENRGHVFVCATSSCFMIATVKSTFPP